MTDVEPLIVSSFERIFPQPTAEADWDGVLRRAGVRSRRYLVGLALVAALVLAPAAWAVAQAFEGKPAPPSVKSFFQVERGVSVKMAKALGRKQPRAIVSKAHGVIQVKTADGPLDLWAAPATGGGTCYLVGWESDLNHAHASVYGGSCVSATAKLNNTDTGGSPHNLDFSSGGDHAHRNYEVVEGYAYGNATTVRVALANGHSKTLPVVEGFFLGVFRRSAKSLAAHRLGQDRIVAVTARNTHGHIVGYWKEPPAPVPAHIVAVGSKHITLVHGARLLSPTRLAITTWGATGCPSLPKLLSIQNRHVIGILLRAGKPPSRTCSTKRVLTPVVIAIDPKQIDVHHKLTIHLYYGAGTTGSKYDTVVLTAPPL